MEKKQTFEVVLYSPHPSKYGGLIMKLKLQPLSLHKLFPNNRVGYGMMIWSARGATSAIVFLNTIMMADCSDLAKRGIPGMCVYTTHFTTFYCLQSHCNLLKTSTLANKLLQWNEPGVALILEVASLEKVFRESDISGLSPRVPTPTQVSCHAHKINIHTCSELQQTSFYNLC
jgi:hypothetical protein